MPHQPSRNIHQGFLFVFVLTLILTVCNAWAQPKIDGEIYAHQREKQATAGKTLSEHQAHLNKYGLTSDLEREACALYVQQRLTTEQISAYTKEGIVIQPDSYVPPVPGQHPLGFYLAKVPYEALQKINDDARIKRLASLEFSMKPHNNVGLAAINVDAVHAGVGVPQARTGNGVKIAVADSGVDVYHGDFPAPIETYDMTDGDNVGEWDTDVANHVEDHGTHVSGSVLGRGTLSGGTYAGGAKDADFYFYKIGNDANAAASGTDEVEAINRALAVGCDIFTMSYGGYTTFMDGSSGTAQAIDAAVAAGMTCFISAGNEQLEARHDSVLVTPGTTSGSFSLTIHNNDGLETYTSQQWIRVIWIDNNTYDENITLNLTNADVGETFTEEYSSMSLRGTEAKRYVLTPDVAAGTSKTYQLTLTNTAGAGATPLVHCYIVSGDATFDSPDPNYTVGNPALADSAIAVGAWTTRTGWTDWQGQGWVYNPPFAINTLAPFSSLGPRVDGTIKPDIVAPGAAIISCRDALSPGDQRRIDNDGFNDGNGPADYYVQQGTSMACPIAAGSAALLIEENPALTPAQLRTALITTASQSGAPDSNVGYGLIDLVAAMNALPDDPNNDVRHWTIME